MVPRAPSPPPRQQPEQSEQRPRSLTSQKTITYREVYENVKKEGSQDKHFIIRFPRRSDKWYILRCDEHDMNFGEFPFSSARNHLDSEAHGHIPRTSENSIAQLGVRVLDCNVRRAKRNNRAYRKALQGGYMPKQCKKKRRRSRAAGVSRNVPSSLKPGHNTVQPAVQSGPFDGIIDPIPGVVYQGAQRASGRELRWYLVVCLPLGNW